MSPTIWRSLWAIYRKDLAVWWRNRATLAASLFPVIGFLLLQSVGVAAVGRNPVALVTLDHGPAGQQMAQIIHAADVFRLVDATPDEAQALLRTLRVAAIVTIPADFTQRVQAHDPAPVDVTLDNLNLDFTNDIRRAVPDAITQYYAAQGDASPIKIDLRETDLRPHDVEFFQFVVLPLLVLLMILNGLVTSAVATAREFESRSIKEMLLSPAPQGVIILGKVLAGFTVTLALGLVVLALGAALQRIQPVTAVSIMIAFYLFFLAGGIGVLAFQPDWLQGIAVFDPLSYGVHGLQMAVFYSANDQLGLDVVVLSLASLGALGLGTLAIRRRIAG